MLSLTGLYDMHLHTAASHDGRSSVFEMGEAAIALGLRGIAVTDHFDTEYYLTTNVAERTALSVASVDEARAVFGDRLHILKGIEVGEGIWGMDYVRDTLTRYDFDVVIGSVHFARYEELPDPYSLIDFSTLPDETIDAVLVAYFDDVAETLDQMDFDILAHLSCPLRYINGKYGRGVDLRRYETVIEAILRRVIEKELALEVNTSGVCDDPTATMPERWILERYFALGGRDITLASDAHIATRVGNAFASVREMLWQIGFRHQCLFEKRQKIRLPL